MDGDDAVENEDKDSGNTIHTLAISTLGMAKDVSCQFAQGKCD